MTLQELVKSIHWKIQCMLIRRIHIEVYWKPWSIIPGLSATFQSQSFGVFTNGTYQWSSLFCWQIVRIRTSYNYDHYWDHPQRFQLCIRPITFGSITDVNPCIFNLPSKGLLMSAFIGSVALESFIYLSASYRATLDQYDSPVAWVCWHE